MLHAHQTKNSSDSKLNLIAIKQALNARQMNH